ncbi:MAG: NAD(P)-binding domain-containing protein [Candidatus Bathyarchaeota archaeon]|nr:NAD(P)-binding domain-containing protein [Candidatus Termiticorpusculum sp.]
MRVCVMGLGNIGLPVIQHISKIYKQTVGYDISQKAVDSAMKNGVTASTELAYADVYIIAVNTWYRNSHTDMSAIEDCVQKVSKLNPNALICFESTLAKGTVRNLSKKYNLSNLAVCPHRWWKQEEDKYGVVQLRVLGALNQESQKNATAFYNTLGVPLHIVSSLEIAELSKIVENSYYYLRIAYAEELKLLCDENNLDFEELRDAVNTKWNVDMAEVRDGIGGECLPKDIQFLISSYPQATLLTGAVTADTNYRTKLCNKNHHPSTFKIESVKEKTNNTIF